MGTFPKPVHQPLTVAALISKTGLSADCVIGDREIVVSSIAPPELADAGSIAFIQGTREMASVVAACKAGVIVGNARLPPSSGRCTIEVPDPRRWYVAALGHLFPPAPARISPTARIADKAQIGSNVSIGEYSVVGANVVLGDDCSIGSHVTIREDCRIGRSCRIQDHTAIGISGAAYYQNPREDWYALPHFGGVFIGNDVDIGAHCAISRGILHDTVIGNGVKIGNLVYISHNTTIGDRAWIVHGAVICGRVEIGAGVRIAAGTCIRDKVRIGEGASIGMGTVVTRDVLPNEMIFGVPGRPRPMRPF